MAEVIRPAMDAARKIGMPVCHVESDWMARQYPHIPARRHTTAKRARPRTGHARPRTWPGLPHTIAPRTHETGKNRLAHSRRTPWFFTPMPWDAYLKSRGITTLIYTGFATDMCILVPEGGARAMLACGYRCVLMRDATIGVETPESFPEKLATRYGTHIFEWQMGYSTAFRDFIHAISNIA